jgi:transposase-like protein
VGDPGLAIDGFSTIEAWRNRPIEGWHPYVYLDGIVLKRSWAGEVRNVSLLVAISVNGESYREILGICEGAKEAAPNTSDAPSSSCAFHDVI